MCRLRNIFLFGVDSGVMTKQRGHGNSSGGGALDAHHPGRRIKVKEDRLPVLSDPPPANTSLTEALWGMSGVHASRTALERRDFFVHRRQGFGGEAVKTE
ncbi:hypothetical protein C0Q70_08202 [Pomacea canaliculata]|uniref:Uncharacterized protein n=1 Tax=Pomacea canaliculata TaxID=400727 RepID=A0A2T7PH62_POMCA|nr:hypothetical protein C0Q70_08202 [Pomacea canaliculata]